MRNKVSRIRGKKTKSERKHSRDKKERIRINCKVSWTVNAASFDGDSSRDDPEEAAIKRINLSRARRPRKIPFQGTSI